jgi:hypothetical protein
VTHADPLVRPLAKIVVELAWLLEDSIDDDGEPRGAMKTLEWSAFVLGDLAPDQREQLVGVLAELACAAEPGQRREFMESFPDAFGLGAIVKTCG